MAEFLLGLPYLRGPLLAKAIELKAPVLVSANTFSTWDVGDEWFMWWHRRSKKHKRTRLRDWMGFKHPSPALVKSVPGGVCLDSAGFVAAAEYNGWPWSVDAYLDLCASAQWRWFASMDWCVEPEVAENDEAVLDRISGTVRLNVMCIQGARQRGIADRLMPVIQGWEVRHYLRCIDRLGPFLDGFSLLGVGSMCRRHVEGQKGILQIIDAIDRELPAGVTLHLFGLKSTGMEEVRGHPRVASVDSQAYGVRARQAALEAGHSKSEAFVAGVMADWYRSQTVRMARAGFQFRDPTPLLDLGLPQPKGFEARIAREAELLRELHEAGEVEWTDVNDRWAYEMAGMEDPEE